MRYGVLEVALAALFGVESDEMGSFRARIRHFRNLGCPQVEQPGSGAQIDYTWGHAFELLLALELQSTGQSPRRAALLAALMADGEHPRVEGGPETEQYYAVVPPGSGPPQLTVCHGRKELLSKLEDGFGVVIVIDLTHCANRLAEELRMIDI